MAEPKTKVNDASVTDFLDGVADERRRADAVEVLELMTDATGCEPRMWGTSIVGFDTYEMTYANGKKGEWMRIGFSPRKSNLVLYIMPGFDKYEELLRRLGKHKTGKSCLYLTRLANVDLAVLRELVDASLAHMRERYP